MRYAAFLIQNHECNNFDANAIISMQNAISSIQNEAILLQNASIAMQNATVSVAACDKFKA